MRFYVDTPLQADSALSLPPGAARHAQVRRVQPGDALWLFDGGGSDWPATVLAVGRSEVRVQVGQPQPVAREMACHVTLALGMPANERMDTLVEKATELGAAVIQPLHTTRSVLRLTGERAERKRAHWQAIAVAASEQCGRARVLQVAPVLDLMAWLPACTAATRWLLSLQPDARALAGEDAGTDAGGHAGSAEGGHTTVATLSGPEGGLTPEEEAAARATGFTAVDLGPRVLRADTAPLAVLAWLALHRPHSRPASPPHPPSKES